MRMGWVKGPWLAMIAGCILASGFVLVQPGQIAKDSGEYHALAQSILHGRYELDGEPSMRREPGYPFFRAFVLLVTNQQAMILWVQVLLFVAIIWLVWDSLHRLDPRLAWIGAWSAALTYGLAIYASRHLLEMFAAFLIALLVWLAMRAIQADRPWQDLIAFSITSAALILTRVSLALIPIALGLMLAWAWRKKGFTELLKRGSLFGLILIAVVSPWVIRNGLTFQVWSITGRTGIQVAARAFKADEGWKRYSDSMGSVLAGRTLYNALYPEANPILTDHWKRVWNRLDAWSLDRNDIDADLALRNEALALMISGPGIFLRSFAWTGVDILRLMALPSPLSAEFSIEDMFWAKQIRQPIGVLDYGILIAAAITQLLWWIGIVLGVCYGLSTYKERFFPAYLLIALLLAHLPADNIVRYAAPIHPWLFFIASLGWSRLLDLWMRRRSIFHRRLV